MTGELLRQLPAIGQWLASTEGARLVAEYSHAEVADVMRVHLDRLRVGLRAGLASLPALESAEYAELLRADLLARRADSLKPVVNATGIVIHTNLGRAPLADAAVEAVSAVAGGYTNLEYDLAAGRRGSRGHHVEALLCELTGAESALVVNNCAAAVVLALRALAGDGEVVVSRGELIEIGGSFRMPDVIAESGARMVEVGTTNRTTQGDYAGAISEATRVLLTSHPSNYRVVGFTTRPAASTLSALARERGVAFVHDLGSGALVDPSLAGLEAEPTVAECLAEGADLVTFSGDKMLGGPQAGIVLGRVDLIERLRRHPYARAARIDKLSLAALVATLRLYREPNDPWEAVPVLRMLRASPDEIGGRAGPVAAAIAALEGFSARVVDNLGYAGGGALPLSELPTRVIEVAHAGLSAQALAAGLREFDRPVIGRIARDRVLLDLRTVLPSQEAGIIEACRRLSA
jgi:L-seryl-tRNA(Ser) seleniumtransferase